MRSPRREFLWATGAAFSSALCEVAFGGFPQRRGMPVPPAPADPQQNAPENPNIRNSQRAVLQQREKTFRDSLEALSERVNQLKQEVQALHSSEVFSVRIYKEAGEIERLAKQLKNLAKG
jgi:hypothetical protein